MSEGRMNGRVQWFNRKRGYGFILVIDPGDHENKEYFCHYSNINTDNYKTLYPGEYVSFSLDKNEKEQVVCVNISGINNGPLLIDNETHTIRVIPKHKMNITEDNLNANLNHTISN